MDSILATQTCRQCQKSFPVYEADQFYYQKFQVPFPSSCPECRSLQRLLQVNEVHLFQRKCDATGESIISNYPPDSEYKVYNQKYWYSDAYDGIIYGRNFDFSRPFFDQFYDLSRLVPRPALCTDYLHDENSAYTNSAGKNKNCYLIFDSDENWDCYYSYGLNNSRSSSDCYRATKLELCYETLDSKSCYNSSFLQNCENCLDSYFLQNCVGCKSCLFCCNLRHKEYHFMNKPISKEEFQTIKDSFSSYKTLEETIKKFLQFSLSFPKKYLQGTQNENVNGNYLVNCKNVYDSYDCLKVWGGHYLTRMFIQAKDCLDCDGCGDGELMYESSICGYNSYNIRFSQHCLHQISNLTYCQYCFFSSDLFGCIGLKRKKYCILNKQYTKEEYESLVPKIIEHLKKTGEWGENFPAKISAFPYNLTEAQDHYPLSKEEALAKGYKWHEEHADMRHATYSQIQIPDNIKDVPDSIAKEILVCENCQKKYKIIPQELSFYQKQGLPLPHLCFYCRHKDRMTLRNPRHLWNRPCQKCGKKNQTTYDPARPEIVYCEECFLNSVY